MARKASMNEALLSIADISRHFSLPESTTRYYCKRFAAFIPSVGEGRRRRYRQETLDVIAAILEQMQKSRTAAAVEDVLQARFPRNALAVSNAETPAQHMAGPLPVFFRLPHCNCWSGKPWLWKAFPISCAWLWSGCPMTSLLRPLWLKTVCTCAKKLKPCVPYCLPPRKRSKRIWNSCDAG